MPWVKKKNKNLLLLDTYNRINPYQKLKKYIKIIRKHIVCKAYYVVFK